MGNEIDELERGRAAYVDGAWVEADRALSSADEVAALAAGDLELLAISAYMLGRDEDHVSGLERAHRAYLDSGEGLRAVRCAIWSCVNLLLRGEMARATGWISRAERLLDREEVDCAERGYLLLPVVVQQVEASGDGEAGYVTAAVMAEVGERFGDADLITLAVHWQGLALVRQGRITEGLARLDEAMVAVTAGECSPILTGVIYCSMIDGCRQVYALSNAREWTQALTLWCDEQPGIVAFTGRCLAHRAEIMQMNGEWADALAEARQAEGRFAAAANMTATAEALYRQAEVRRLQGRLADAELAYREAGRLGWEPQPGLALLRLAQGDERAAVAAIRRAVGETGDSLKRAGLLPAYVEIMVASGNGEEARGACRELEEIAESSASSSLRAMAWHAEAMVDLAEGAAQAALVSARRAAGAWQQLGVPYEVARARVAVGLACRELGDHDAAALDLEAAGEAFARLGAARDLVLVDSLTTNAQPQDGHGLTPRELEVLRLVAAGNSNRAIAAELVVSERTVDRHVSNMFAKLRVSSRTAATAYAYEQRLL